MSLANAVEADVMRCGYDVGFFDTADITAWADRQIESMADPPTELLDLAMIRRTHPIDVINLLRSLGSVDPATSTQTQIGFIGLLLANRSITTKVAIRGLWALVHEPGTTREQQSQIYELDDGYDLAASATYGTIADVERELVEFVTPYAQQLARLYPNLISSAKG